MKEISIRVLLAAFFLAIFVLNVVQINNGFLLNNTFKILSAAGGAIISLGFAIGIVFFSKPVK